MFGTWYAINGFLYFARLRRLVNGGGQVHIPGFSLLANLLVVNCVPWSFHVQGRDILCTLQDVDVICARMT